MQENVFIPKSGLQLTFSVPAILKCTHILTTRTHLFHSFFFFTSHHNIQKKWGQWVRQKYREIEWWQLHWFFLCFSGASVNVQDLTPSCAGALYGTYKPPPPHSPILLLFRVFFKHPVFFTQVLWIWWGPLWVCNLNLIWMSGMCEIPALTARLMLHRSAAGVLFRLSDRDHPVVGHSVLPHHFSKCHRSWDLSHLWRCSAPWSDSSLPARCGLKYCL